MNKATRWILAAAVAAAAAVAVAAAATATAPPSLSQVLAEQRKHVAEHPDDPAALNDLGNLLQLAGEPAEAETAYRRALELAPDLVSARFNLALLLQRAERYREAVAEFEAVVERAPSHARAHYQIGSIYELQGDDRRAVRWYGEAFALEPRLAFPEFNPSVIENQLVEEAMLVGYRAEAARPLAAQVYEQPSRIRQMMLPPDPATEEAAPKDPFEQPIHKPADLGEEPDLPRAGAAGGETLDSGSLDAREVNQAAPQGRASARRQAAGQATPQRTFQRPTTGQPADSPQPGAVGTPGTLVVQPGFVPQPGQAQPQQRVIRPPGGTPRLRRGVESTGRLELQLVPEATERRG